MTPYREPAEPTYEGADDDQCCYLEERIVDRYASRRPVGFEGYALVQLNAGDFTSMARRFSAKVEEHATGFLSMTMHTAAGKLIALSVSTVPADRYRIELVPHTRAFQPGDVVRLKSGQTPMTVGGYDNADKVQCLWFEAGTLARAMFHEFVLEKCEAPR